jgi:hypothetical protein
MMNINARLNLLKIAHMIILIMFIFFSSNPHHAIGKSLKSPKLVFVSPTKGPVAPSAPSACTYIPGNKGGHCWMQLRARASNTFSAAQLCSCNEYSVLRSSIPICRLQKYLCSCWQLSLTCNVQIIREVVDYASKYLLTRSSCNSIDKYRMVTKLCLNDYVLSHWNEFMYIRSVIIAR